mmetsp:Transcript_872/g.1411  ORF Transcript_872/g.1411 Transcript_872/m.1411 type:complete len:178 (-) Transcript_872:73-606(-)
MSRINLTSSQLLKMGYPEVTSHILGPIYSPEFYYFNKPFRVMSFISGIAYIIHHAGGELCGWVIIFAFLSVFWEAALTSTSTFILFSRTGTILYMVVSLHEMNPLSLGFLALAVGMQHLVVFVKYRYKHLHSFLLVGLEVWFQLESYYALTFATTTARVGIGMLLISHYSKKFLIIV